MLDPEAGSGSVSFLPESVRPLALTRGSSCPHLHTHTGVPASSEPRWVVLTLGLRQEASQPGGRPWRGPTRAAAGVTRHRMLPEAERQASSAGARLSCSPRGSEPLLGLAQAGAGQWPPRFRHPVCVPCMCTLCQGVCITDACHVCTLYTLTDLFPVYTVSLLDTVCVLYINICIIYTCYVPIIHGNRIYSLCVSYAC